MGLREVFLSKVYSIIYMCVERLGSLMDEAKFTVLSMIPYNYLHVMKPENKSKLHLSKINSYYIKLV